jgi:hypothetical protein
VAKKGDTRWHADDDRKLDRGGRTCPTCQGAKRVIRNRAGTSTGNPGEVYEDDEYKDCGECKGTGTI